MKYIALIIVLLLTSCTKIPQEINSHPQVYFCPRDNCAIILEELIKNSKDTIHCALYDLDLDNIITSLKKKSSYIDVKVILEDTTIEKHDFIRFDYDKQQMHNKFCIFDNRIVLTGSFNPTFRGNTKNNNNIIIIQSNYISKNYEKEFQEIWNKKESKTPYPLIHLNNKTIETLFCPEDNCKERVIDTINNAKSSIYFMLFYMTDRDIANIIIKKHQQGIKIKGILEKRNNNKWSQFNYLNNSNIDIILDKNNANLHHKVFIIDNKTVITGSYNPTKNGNLHNDENILILHNREIASKYLEEFNYIYTYNVSI